MTHSSIPPEDTSQLFTLILDRLISIESCLNATSKTWLKKSEAATLLNISTTTLAEWRQQNQWGDGSFPWQRGVHYVQQPGKSGQFEYNRFLLEDWRLNRQDWRAHQRAIDWWVSMLPCNQSQSRRRKAG